MDIQLAHDTFVYAIQAAEILGIDKERVQLWKKTRDKLPDIKVGNDGRLLEWDKEREEAEPGHRHLSHLYGLYPSDIFMKPCCKEQYEGAVKSFYHRMEQGSGYTGWSAAWSACIYARIGDSGGFYRCLKK